MRVWRNRCLGCFDFVIFLLLFASTARADSILNFPRLSFEPNTLTGIAIVNPSSQNAAVTLTAYGTDGRPLAASGFQNPAQLTIPANQQVSKLISEVFAGTLPASVVGWFQATSSVDGLTGFFLFLDGSITVFDGADLPPSAARIVFNQVRLDSGFTTELNVINTTNAGANVQLRLAIAGGSPVDKSLTIPAKGISRLDAATFFETTATSASTGAYITITADSDIAGFEFVKSPGGDLLGLNARSATEQLKNLYFPQMAVLGPWRTEVGLVNYSDSPVILTITAYKREGTPYGTENLKNNPVTRTLNAGGSLREDVASLFGFSGPNVLDGWIKVESTSASVNGYVSYGAGRSVAAVASAPQGLTAAIFSHIATTAGFFNGVAVLNPGTLATNVRILAIQPSGRVLGSYDAVLQPGQRLSNLINELIPQAAAQAGGVIWIKSDQPVFLTELFGTDNTLANVPAQPAPQSYRPDAALLSLKLVPALAPVQVGSSQAFQVQNSSGPFTWKVNGAPGGNPRVGTITSEGLYRAPSAVPAPQVLTVTAETTSQIAGASVDVLKKETLVTGLGVVQSVAYLGSLRKLYAAELAIVNASKPSAQTTTSSIFEISPSGPKVAIASFSNELVSKMVPFTASDGKEFLLLAGQTSGRIVRLNPVTKESADVATGLNQPAALVINPVTGDLLVAEADKISIVPKSNLEAPTSFKENSSFIDPARRTVTLFSGVGASGLVMDACTGDIYFSDSTAGSIRKFLQINGQVVTVVSGLNNPGQLLGLYRNGVSCPFALQLLVIERGLDRILLVVPRDASVASWLPAQSATDLFLLPRDTGLVSSEAVLLAEASGQLSSQVSVVSVPDTYKTETTTPPIKDRCLGSVVFADANLEAAVRNALRIGSQTQITCELIGSLTVLDARNKGVSNLSGLEAFTNLRKLVLEGNSIRDVRPLALLTGLTYLSLGDPFVIQPKPNGSNFVSDISPLFELTNLTFLSLSSNSVSDLRPLSRLTNLVYLDLSGNFVADLIPLSKLSRLLVLSFRNDRVRDISPLAGLSGLRDLDMYINSVSDIRPLSSLTNLSFLVFDTNQVSDITPLSGLIRLKDLFIGNNSIRNLAPLAGLTNLRTLWAFNNGASNVSPLSALTGLQELRIDNNSISDIRPLSGLVRLSTLSLNNNQLSDLTPLSGLINLNVLNLFGNLISDIRPLVLNSGLGAGDSIDLRSNNLTASNCADLKTLISRGAAVNFSPQRSGTVSCP